MYLCNPNNRWFKPATSLSTFSSSLTFNITRTQPIKDKTLITALRQCFTVSSYQTPPLISRLRASSLTKPSVLCQPSHVRSTSFNLSPYPLSSQSVIPCLPIPNHSYHYVQHTRTLLVVHGLPAHNSQTVHQLNMFGTMKYNFDDPRIMSFQHNAN